MDLLTIANRALVATGNRPLTVLNDGTDEWQVVDTTLQRHIDDLLSGHPWAFARKSADLVKADDDDNPSIEFDYAHRLPADCLHLVAVYSDGAPTTDYRIYGRLVCLDQDADIQVEYIAEPADSAWHPQATEILTRMLEIGLLRGMNEDDTEADKREILLEQKLGRARAAADQENPARNTYRRTASEARNRRRG